MKRKAFAILIKEIIKRNLGIILIWAPAIIGFVITFVIGMFNINDIFVTLLLALFVAWICFAAFVIIFTIVDAIIKLKKEYDNILDNLNNCHDENK